MISREQVDALAYGQRVRLEIPSRGLVLEGPVLGQNGYKAVQGLTLRLAWADQVNAGEEIVETRTSYYELPGLYGEPSVKIPMATTERVTGYPDDILAGGVLTVLDTP